MVIISSIKSHDEPFVIDEDDGGNIVVDEDDEEDGRISS